MTYTHPVCADCFCPAAHATRGASSWREAASARAVQRAGDSPPRKGQLKSTKQGGREVTRRGNAKVPEPKWRQAASAFALTCEPSLRGLCNVRPCQLASTHNAVTCSRPVFENCVFSVTRVTKGATSWRGSCPGACCTARRDSPQKCSLSAARKCTGCGRGRREPGTVGTVAADAGDQKWTF